MIHTFMLHLTHKVCIACEVALSPELHQWHQTIGHDVQMLKDLWYKTYSHRLGNSQRSTLDVSYDFKIDVLGKIIHFKKDGNCCSIKSRKKNKE